MLEIGDLDKKVDVTLEYFIKDFNGNQIKIGEETVGVYKDLVIERKFPLPRWLEFEDYLFYVKLSYLDSVATSANRFTIVKEPAFISYIKNNFIILLIFILIPITLFLVIKLRKKSEKTKVKIKHPLRGLPNKVYVDFLRFIYKFKLLRAEYEAGFFDKQITAIKNLLKKILEFIQNYLRAVKHLLVGLFNKIYVIYLRVIYKFKLLRAEYEAGFFDKQITAIKNLLKKISEFIQNFLRMVKDIIKGLSNKIFVDFLRIIYKFKLLRAEYEAGFFDKQIKSVKNLLKKIRKKRKKSKKKKKKTPKNKSIYI